MKKIVVLIILTITLLKIIPSIVFGGGSNVPTKNTIFSELNKKNETQLISLKPESIPLGCNLSDENLGESNKENNYSLRVIELIIGGFIGAVIAFWLEQFKEPKLVLNVGEDANQDHNYPNHATPGRWKFFRIKVINKQLPKWLSWLMTRHTAEQVHARITFNKINKTMKGRWAGTVEIPFENPFDVAKMINYPEPETIFVGEHEYLDVFVKYENDTEAYGWNNEAYISNNNWRTPKYKLNPGDYDIEISLIGTNVRVKKKFKAHIENTIDSSYLETEQ